MSEIAETPKGIEKEAGVVKRVAERVSTFLSETYTLKGAKAKEMKKYAGVFAQFTPSQRSEMQAYYDQKVSKTATWNVIRNWVVTGAGLALGYGALTHPGLLWTFVTDTAPKAIAGGADAVFKWMFKPITLEITKGSLALLPTTGEVVKWQLPGLTLNPLNIPLITGIHIK